MNLTAKQATSSIRIVALLVAGCTGTPEPGSCPDPSPPAAPSIVSLGTNTRSIVPGELKVEVSGFVDDDGDEFRRLEVEIWRGQQRAWRGETADPALRNLRLADGVFDGAAAAAGALEPWANHVIRARYVSTTGDCDSEGVWSMDRTFRTDDGSATLFDPYVVREYRVELSEQSYQQIDAEALPPDCVTYERNYYDATLRYEGQTFANVGARIKGGCGSSRDLSGKAALKLNLSWDSPQIAGCPNERRLHGLKRLTFNNMVQDASMSHELLAYAFYREMGVAVPRAALMKLYVNDALFGIYLNLETIDRRFLARHFVSNKGMLYEGSYFCDLDGSSIRDDDTGCLTREFKPDSCGGLPQADEDPLDYQPIRQLIANIDALPEGGFYPAIAQHVDMESLLAMWAVEAMLGHWDGYVYEVRNNYRIYHDPATDLWTIIPSGLDQTFQRLDLDSWTAAGKLASRCLAEPACEAAFAAKLRQANDVFASMNLPMQRERWRAVIEGLAPEPGREFDQSTFEQGHSDTQSFIDLRPGIVARQLQDHGF